MRAAVSAPEAIAITRSQPSSHASRVGARCALRESCPAPWRASSAQAAWALASVSSVHRYASLARVPGLDARMAPHRGMKGHELGTPFPHVGRDVVDLARDEGCHRDEQLEIGHLKVR